MKKTVYLLLITVMVATLFCGCAIGVPIFIDNSTDKKGAANVRNIYVSAASALTEIMYDHYDEELTSSIKAEIISCANDLLGDTFTITTDNITFTVNTESDTVMVSDLAIESVNYDGYTYDVNTSQVYKGSFEPETTIPRSTIISGEDRSGVLYVQSVYAAAGATLREIKINYHGEELTDSIKAKIIERTNDRFKDTVTITADNIIFSVNTKDDIVMVDDLRIKSVNYNGYIYVAKTEKVYKGSVEVGNEVSF